MEVYTIDQNSLLSCLYQLDPTVIGYWLYPLDRLLEQCFKKKLGCGISKFDSALG